MGIVFRQSVKSTAITFFGALLGAAVMFISTSLIPKQELGFVRNLISQTVIASFFVLMGFNNTLFYYFHRFDGEKPKRAVLLSICFLVPLIILGISFLPYCLFPGYFMHYFKAMSRDRVGSYHTRGELEKFMTQWVSQYVSLDDQSSWMIRAKQPLREARTFRP